MMSDTRPRCFLDESLLRIYAVVETQAEVTYRCLCPSCGAHYHLEMTLAKLPDKAENRS